ncbi:type I DNA topoisomerase [Candidatus Dependentiae bacterium]|nr:type I DNA topoisomerase [Candidatus Dependentiae bacterium]
MKKLLIVESPAKIKTIQKFLGKDFKIMSTVGHIKDLPQKELGVAIDKDVEITYVVMDKKDKVIADIVKEAQKADEIYLAPDPDREGEIIAWHIAQEIEKVVKDKSKIHRITFNEITDTAIKEAIEHPSSIDLPKVAAQQARRVLDRWVGYEVSPILWQKIKKGLSAGRVQSVALKMIVDREEEIRGFKPEEYWTVDGVFSNGKSQLTASLTHIDDKKAELKNEVETKDVVKKLEKEKYEIESIKDSKRLKNPNPPFMTSTLQQAAYNQLGFSVQKTMTIAQQLYEGVPLEDKSTPVALITYMRTDSLRIADTALKQVRSFIESSYGDDYLPAKANLYSKAKAQDAHEAVRPIDVKLSPEKIKKYLETDVAKLYELIWNRFVSSQMKPAQYAQRQIVIKGGIFTFKVTGSTLIFDGYLKLYKDEDEEEEKISIPKDIKEKQKLDLLKTLPKQHFTQPPPRYTQASLVKDLEKEKIGRPSTYASILKTIQAREYTELDTKKRFVPTELGMAVTKMLETNLPDVINVKFTSAMEEDLDKIAQGKLERDKLLKSFYKIFKKDLDTFRGQQAKRSAEPTEIDCPKCKKGKLAIRFGKSGPFLGCLRFPECDFTSNFERLEDGTIKLVETKKPQLLEEKCDLCQSYLRQVIGRYGPFIACSAYPECKFIKQNKANFKCPLCKKGDVIERSWKGKTFWGCSRYPECKFTISGQIEQIKCPKCKKSPYLLKRFDKEGNITLSCPDKECGYSKEIGPEAES